MGMCFTTNLLWDGYNSNSVGGFGGLISQDVLLNDGVFEVTLIRMPKNPVELSEVLAALTNIRQESDMLYTFQTSEIKFTSNEDVSWTLDGEYGGDHSQVKITNCVRALEILVE